MADQTEQSGPRKVQRSKVGLVVSKSADKTVIVAMNRLAKHPRYGKFVRRRTRLAVHDPENRAGEGDLVEITPCRRISKTKSWRLVRVVRVSAMRAAE
jgi:small subunit ribosomal protein S17